VEADPENAPESIRNIATEHGLEVVIFSVSADDVVEYIADLAAGDAREGVALLRRAAAEIKEAAGRRGLTTGVVDGVVEGAERDIL
jgi:Cdc6-like AAA superfamily ATPase